MTTTTLLHPAGFLWRYGADPINGSITIGGVSMHGPAWNVPSLFDLLATPDQRGADRLLPHAVGVIPYRRRATVTRRSLPFLVNGYWNRIGEQNDDPAAGLADNVAYLNEFVLLPTNVGDGTRPLVWTAANGTAVTVDVHVLPIPTPEGLAGSASFRTTLELSVPNGDLYL